MKKYISFAIYIILIISFSFAIDCLAGFLFDRYIFINYDAKLKYAHEGGGDEELIILGASRASHHYIPAVLENEIGLTCFNYGIDGRNIFNQYVVAREILDHSSTPPKVIVLEVASMDIENTPGWNEEKLSNLYVLYKQSKYVKEVIDGQCSGVAFALRYSNLFRYNSLLITLLKTSIAGDPQIDKNKGYVQLYSRWEKDVETIDNKEIFIEYPAKEFYLRKLIETCKDSGICLLVYNSPCYKKYRQPQQWISRISQICAEYDVPFTDYSLDSVFLSQKNWFKDPNHLNGDGANYFSMKVAKEIKSYVNQ